MQGNRLERANQALRDSAAEFVARSAGPQSLITITRAEVASDFSHLTLFLSVLPEEKTAAALGLLTRSLPELKEHLKKRVRMPRMPHVEFSVERL